MASIYVCDVIGDGTRRDPFRAAVVDVATQITVVLMIDTDRMKSIVYSPDDTITGAGIIQLVTAASWAQFRQGARNASPTAQRRTAMNTWLSNAGYPTIPAGLTTWYDIIHAAVRFIEPAFSIDTAGFV